MGGRANIAGGVVEDKILEMHEFAINPQRGAGVGEILPFEEACTDRRAGNALVETRQGDGSVKSRAHQVRHADFLEIVSH